MSADKVIAPLLRVPLFRGLHHLQLTEISRHAERMSFKRTGIITQRGATGDGAYLIVSGEAVRMPDPGSSEQPEAIEPGSVIGELAMLVDHTYGSAVVAQGRVNCLKILRSALYEQMERDPSLAEHFSNCLADRLSQLASEMRRIDQMLSVYAGDPVGEPVPVGEPEAEAEPEPTLAVTHNAPAGL